MYRINWIELHNFRSFIGTHKWVLGLGAGLFQITGRNNDNPRLDKNGIGKSSLLDALRWCLYGTTTRGLRGPDVINDDSTSCYVCVNLDIGDETLTVKTTQSPNSLTVNDRPIDRDNLTKRLRLNGEAFLYSVIIPQFGDSFLDLTPSRKLDVFSQVVDLDWCLEKSEQAQEQAKELETKINLIEREISALKAKTELIFSTIDSLKLKASEWDGKQLSKINEIQIKIEKNLGQIVSYISELEVLEKLSVSLGSNIQSCEDMLKANSDKSEGFEYELIEANKEMILIDHKISALRRMQSRLQGVGSVCPTCNQQVDQQHIINELGIANKELKSLYSERTVLSKAIDAIKDDQNKTYREKSALIQEYNTHKSKDAGAKGNISSLSSEIEYLKRDNSSSKAKITQIKSEDNVFNDLISAKTDELNETLEVMSRKNDEVKKLNEDYEAVRFWIGGFKRLRLYIVEETLRSLEVEVNNNLTALGMSDWTIEFDIERENKSGGVTKGFSTMIIKPSGKVAKYEAISGGEGQRVKLAACFGFANLIMERSGLVNKTEFFDELSQHLSDSGVDDMLATLKDRSIKADKQIWVIDHRSTAFSDFDGTLIVEKNEDGSKLLLT